MSIRAILLAGVLGVPLVAGVALAAGTGDLSLVNAAKQGDRNAVQSLLNSPAKKDVAGAEGVAALIWAASRKGALCGRGQCGSDDDQEAPGGRGRS
jgi:hypothetical protein